MSTYYWIKERENPQLRVYYVAYGALSIKEVKTKEGSLYGSSTMHRFISMKAYDAEIDRIVASGKNVHYMELKTRFLGKRERSTKN